LGTVTFSGTSKTVPPFGETIILDYEKKVTVPRYFIVFSCKSSGDAYTLRAKKPAGK
jgi:hypothetical protein